jgi:hypothetical protein
MAVLLPPVYAATAPVILVAIAYCFVRRGVPHRRVFTAATMSVSYVLAGEIFRLSRCPLQATPQGLAATRSPGR